MVPECSSRGLRGLKLIVLKCHRTRIPTYESTPPQLRGLKHKSVSTRTACGVLLYESPRLYMAPERSLREVRGFLGKDEFRMMNDENRI